MGVIIASWGLFGCLFIGAGKSRREVYSLLLAGFASTVTAWTLLASTGCSSYSNPTNHGTASVVTTTSGALMHTSTVRLTFEKRGESAPRCTPSSHPPLLTL
jgi:hypothetical protein